MKRTILISLVIIITVIILANWIVAYATQLRINSGGQVVLKNSTLNINPKYPDFVAQWLQDKDDWVDSGGTIGEYTSEEATWTEVTGSPFVGYDAINYAGSGGDLDLDSGQIKRDERTGLWWSDIASVGGTASTTDNVFTWTAAGSRPTGGNAIGFCEALNTASFGGHNDWYLPTQKELQQAYIDGSANNLLEPGRTFWSSTESYSSSGYAWYVRLYYGYTSTNTKGTSSDVRCVRR